jgi:gamma-glutamyl hercynylcysteine S-oxide synthase
MAEAKETELEIDDIHVRLKPILGVKPGHYLTGLYAVAILFLIFLILFLPGIRKHGSVVRFESFPEVAAVYVDGAYAGATPVKTFVESGSREIVFEKLGFRTEASSIEVPGRLFGSLFFPKRIAVDIALDLSQPDMLLSQSFYQLSSWALVSQFTATYLPEPVASNAMKAFASNVAEGVEPSAQEESATEYIRAAILNASSPEISADIIRAAVHAFSGRGVTTVESMLDMLRFFIQLASKYENSIFLLPELLSRSAVDGFIDDAWFSSLIQAYGTSLAFPSPLYSGSLRSIDMDGYRFIRMPEGVYARGMSQSSQEHPYLRPVAGFLIQHGEVTQGEYARFIESVPMWEPENVDELVANGLVTIDYLTDWDPQVRPDYPVRFVSWYAASAYAAWLDDAVTSNLHIRLPSETEWEWAALLAGEDPAIVFETKKRGPEPIDDAKRSLPVPANLLGNLWEWCESWYYPNAYLLTSFSGNALEDVVGDYAGVERVLRGGSWADDATSRIDTTTRGSNPPDWCTPFTGFRVVAVETENG